MSLQTRLEALVSAIGADIKAIRTSAGGWSEQILTTTYTNSTVTASDVFAGFVPVANTRYQVEILASVTAAAVTTGVQASLAGPTTGVTAAAVKIVAASAASTDLISHSGLNTFIASTAGLTTPSLLMVDAILEFATPGAGNVKLQARSEVAASAITIRPGSIFRWRVV